jgi:hypothetical protein
VEAIAKASAVMITSFFIFALWNNEFAASDLFLTPSWLLLFPIVRRNPSIPNTLRNTLH